MDGDEQVLREALESLETAADHIQRDWRKSGNMFRTQ
jgi:hypothetical protein